MPQLQPSRAHVNSRQTPNESELGNESSSPSQRPINSNNSSLKSGQPIEIEQLDLGLEQEIDDETLL